MSSGDLRLLAIGHFVPDSRLFFCGIALRDGDPARCRNFAIRLSLNRNSERQACHDQMLRKPRYSGLRFADAPREILLQDLVGLEIVGKRAHA